MDMRHYPWRVSQGETPAYTEDNKRTRHPGDPTIALGWLNSKFDELCSAVLSECYRYDVLPGRRFNHVKDQPAKLVKLIADLWE